MAAMRRNHQRIADAEVPRLLFVFKVKRRTSAQDQNPFALLLVIPALGWAAGLTGMNSLEAPVLSTGEHVGLFLA